MYTSVPHKCRERSRAFALDAASAEAAVLHRLLMMFALQDIASGEQWVGLLTAAEMGAGAGVTGSPGRDDDGDGGARQRSESDAVELCASSSSTALADLEADDGGALKRRCE